jgi:hypothetical protein
VDVEPVAEGDGVRTVRAAAALGALAMAATIVYGFVAGSFTEEGAVLLGLAWGRVTLVDLGLAFALVWAWIAWREASPWRGAAWLVATVTTGSLALFLYVFLAAGRATDGAALLVGPHRSRHEGARSSAIAHRARRCER